MQKKYEQFSKHFLDEVFKLCLYKKDICDIVSTHLDYSYIPVELKGYKHLLKAIVTYYRATNKLPTIGILTQNNQTPEVFEIIESINKIKLPDKEEILNALEGYIKRVKFQQLFTKVSEVYNSGEQEEAINLQATESQKIANLSIRGSSSYMEDVFNNFKIRDDDRFLKCQSLGEVHSKVPFGIDMLDKITHGGSEPGDIDCFLGRSGTGKTKWLRWRAVSAARMGAKVLHIQAEGTMKECLLGFDATWTAVLKKDLKKGDISKEVSSKIDKAIANIKLKGGNIKVIAYEQFNTASMKDVREAIIDYIKIEGEPPHLMTLDYLELFDPGDGRRYATNTEGEKYRREASARALKNICNEFGIRGATAFQANDIPPSDFNKIDWVMTRHNVAGAKGLVNAFSYFFTWNVSSDEYNKNLGRLYVDKMRDFKGSQLVRIATCFDRDRFYDRANTIKLFSTDYEN